ncbi:MAG: hypothetical protein ACQEVD_15930 [Actinomycetota bacterium]
MLLAVVALLALVAGPVAVNGTLAGWSDSKESRGEFVAATIPAPKLTQDCEYRPGVIGLGARVRIFWRLPAGYQLDDIVVEASTSGLGSILAPLTSFNLSGNTISTGNGTYRTDIPTYLLGGLLGLGTELEIAFVVEHESGWQSEAASIASNAGLILGLNGNCRNLTPIG